MRFGVWRVGAISCALAAWAVASTAWGGGKLVRKTHRFEVPQGESLRVTYRCNGWIWGGAFLQQGTNERQQVSWRDQRMEEGGGKAGGVRTNYERYGVHFYANTEKTRKSIPCLDVRYWLMPNFHKNALYDHAQVTNNWAKWHEDYPLADRRAFVFDFRYDRATDLTYVYLDSQYAGTLKYPGQLTGIECTVAQESEIVFEPYKWEKEDAYRLPKLFPSRAAACLRKGAKLEVDPKCRAALADMEVWSPEDSIDQGCHAQTTTRYAFGWNPMYQRTPWATGPEYMQWTIPGNFYLYADVLCADIPQEGRVPVVGSSLTRFGASNSETFARAFTDLSTAATNAAVRTVGSLAYVKDGQRVKTPLYLVRQRLNIGQIPHILNDLPIYLTNEVTGAHGRLQRMLPRIANYLDFELVGGGTGKGKPVSSVQVFGVTLTPAPYSFDIDESVGGNIFADDEVPETGVRVTAIEDGAKGSVDWTITDDDFRVLRTGSQDFALAKKGDAKRLSFDLRMPQLGWYRLVYVFRGAKGEELMRHEAAFTLLGRNDREAGFESPYAFWPQGTGRTQHRDTKEWGYWNLGRANCNPDRREVVRKMIKAGYHSGWGVPYESEDEFPGAQLTLSAFSDYCNGIYWPPKRRYKPEDAVTISNRIEKAVVWYREQRQRFPHCKTIQILHEQGGKLIAQELLGNRKAVRGEYRGIEGDHLVYWCTELAKRMRKEFPDCHLQIGNGSSSCEMIADLCRNGFDLDLVDTLGIESKGFQTMPELPNHLESPGMLWALKAIAAEYGYSNKLVNACNEYVFRPERPANVAPTVPRRRRMEVTDFTLRDFLISLAHGCWTISTGHPEDCNNDYYGTNWGAGGQCTFYPFSYPKRMFTGIATLTKVMDKVKFSKCLDLGAGATYCLEFRRDRKVKDYAYAYWTARCDSVVRVAFPAGARVRSVDWQGREGELKLENGVADVVASSTPAYFISDQPMASAKFLRSVRAPVRGKMTVLVRPDAKTFFQFKPKQPHEVRNDAQIGEFELRMVEDPEWSSPVLETKLVRTEPAPPLVKTEHGSFVYSGDPRTHRREQHWSDDYDEIGIWVRGNGSFGKVTLHLAGDHVGYNLTDIDYHSYVCHDGWQLMRTKLPPNMKDGRNHPFQIATITVYACRNALNPRDMRPVEGEIALGPVVGIKYGPGERSFDADVKIDDVMSEIDEKDL